MNSSSSCGTAVCELYGEALPKLTQSGVPFLVGGAFALERYTGIARDTKDLDVFLRQRDLDAALAVFATVGCRTEITFPHWLAKAITAEGVIDIIFSAGNGVAVVDDGWFEHAVEATVLGMPVKLCPPEETLVVAAPRSDGPAAARNTGAREATGDVLVFVDADVLVHRDAFARIRAAFASDPNLTAVFGSYDDDPADRHPSGERSCPIASSRSDCRGVGIGGQPIGRTRRHLLCIWLAGERFRLCT